MTIRVVFLYLILISSSVHSQKFSFDNTSNTRVKKSINFEIKKAIEDKNIELFKGALSKLNEKQVYSKEEKKVVDDFGTVSTRFIPLSIDLYNNIISGNLSYAFFDEFFLANLDINCEVNNQNLLYKILDDIASQPIEKSKNQITFSKYFATKYDINKEFRTLEIPLFYLLNKTYQLQGNKYTKEFISDETIILFLEKGSPINSYDENGNSLLDFAIMADKNKLIEYLADKGVDFTKINKEGKNSLFYAIESQNESLVKTYISRFNGKVSPIYLQGIKIGDANIYGSPTIAKMLKDEAIKNVNNLAEAIVFCSLFKHDKNTLINPLLLDLSDAEIPNFISLFDKKTLNVLQSETIQKLETRYINNAASFTELNARLNKIPLFAPFQNYSSNDNEMALNNRLQSLKGELNRIDNTMFSELKSRLNIQFEEIKSRVANIQVQKLKIEKFFNSVKNVDNFFWIGKGDGATFWEKITLDENSKFAKYKLCLLSKFENKSNENYNGTLTVRYYYFKNSKTIDLFHYDTKSERYSVDVNTNFEIPAQSTRYVVSVYNFKEQAQSFGILGSGSIVIDRENPYTLWHNQYNGNVSIESISYQNQLISQLRENKMIETKNNWGDAWEDFCFACTIDVSKSKGPKWEFNLWNDLIEKNGVIVMKNGSKYEFKKIIKDRKVKYKFIGNNFYLENDKNFDSFDDLINNLERYCKEKNCK